MSEGQKAAGGPDLAAGIALSEIADGTMLVGHVGDKDVLLARRGDEVFAIGAFCTHYHGPLAEGLLVDDTVRCPWHHACFSLRTGEALRPPALNPVACWRVETKDGRVRVVEKLAPAPSRPSRAAAGGPKSIVIVGGGAAADVAAATLRHEGYAGALTMLSADTSAPYDRPNCSKDYLAGSAPEEWLPLRSPEFYKEHAIEIKLRARVAAVDTAARQVVLEDGGTHGYDALLLATGAEPVRLDVPGADLPHVCTLRSLADSRALIAKAGTARRAVVVGASFIGLEVAASLRARKLEVDVVALDAIPMERVMGRELGQFIQQLHEEQGVRFHLQTTVASVDANSVTLKSGERLAADLVVVGIGVRPVIALAEKAGLAIDRGLSVDEYLETNIPGIFGAGDIARWPDRLTAERIRVEHWVHAQRQAQAAARNMLGRRERFDAVPFFWSQHYDVAISYVGHAERWDRSDLDGRPEEKDCRVTFWRGDRKLAVATIFRDIESLRAELELERVAA